MEKIYEEWNGTKFPVRVVASPEEWGCGSPLLYADYDLYAAYEYEYEKGNKKAEEIDNSIFFFFDSGFIASDPTDEEIIKKVTKVLDL